MQRWLLKAVVQKAISYLPLAHKINYRLQRLTTLRQELPEAFFLDRLTHFRNHYNFFRKYYAGFQTSYKVLELGTGWHPIVPLGFYLSGAKNIITLDIRRLITDHSLQQTLQKFKQLNQSGRLDQYIPDLQPDRFQNLLNITEVNPQPRPYDFLKELEIDARQGDARHLDLPGGSQDLIISNNVLQDIAPAILDQIFPELARVAKPGGIMSHVIDMSDQFSHFDAAITPFNYLQFSERQWSLLTNRLQKQNRCRITFYRTLFQKINLRVLEEVNNMGQVQELRQINLHPQFRTIPEKDVLVLHSHVVGMM